MKLQQDIASSMDKTTVPSNPCGRLKPMPHRSDFSIEMEHIKHFRSLLSVPNNNIMSELHCHGNLLTSSKTTSVFEAGLGC